MLTTSLCKKIIIAKPKELKTGRQIRQNLLRLWLIKDFVTEDDDDGSVSILIKDSALQLKAYIE
jgi:hypothetical protein